MPDVSPMMTVSSNDATTAQAGRGLSGGACCLGPSGSITTSRRGCGRSSSSASGSRLFTIFSTRIAGDGDPGRIAAQIVTGIGFLGAGRHPPAARAGGGPDHGVDDLGGGGAGHRAWAWATCSSRRSRRRWWCSCWPCCPPSSAISSRPTALKSVQDHGDAGPGRAGPAAEAV